MAAHLTASHSILVLAAGEHPWGRALPTAHLVIAETASIQLVVVSPLIVTDDPLRSGIDLAMDRRQIAFVF